MKPQAVPVLCGSRKDVDPIVELGGGAGPKRRVSGELEDDDERYEGFIRQRKRCLKWPSRLKGGPSNLPAAYTRPRPGR